MLITSPSAYRSSTQTVLMSNLHDNSFFTCSSFLPARKQGRAYQNAYQNQVLFWYTYYHKMYRKSIIFCKYVYYV